MAAVTLPVQVPGSSGLLAADLSMTTTADTYEVAYSPDLVILLHNTSAGAVVTTLIAQQTRPGLTAAGKTITMAAGSKYILSGFEVLPFVHPTTGRIAFSSDTNNQPKITPILAN